jgi:hypothetical protein
MNSKLTKAQTLTVIRRIRAAIAAGKPKVLDDSEEIGNKYTHCSWGMCATTEEYYPTPDLYEPGSRDPMRWPTGHGCPMDRGRKTEAHWGCFYRCRAFHGGVNREQALALYDEAIKELEAEPQPPQPPEF